MQNLTFNYHNSALLDTDQIINQAQKLIPDIEQIKKSLEQEYSTEYAFLHLPHDHGLLKTVNTLVAEKQPLQPTVLVVIGIGGSNLGTVAVHEAVLGKMYNALDPSIHRICDSQRCCDSGSALMMHAEGPFVVSEGRSPKSNPNERSHPFDSGPSGLRSGRTANGIQILFADTVDADYIHDLLTIVEHELQQKHNVILNVVSKSGTTTETVANFELFLALLKKYHPNDYQNYVVATTDKDSTLWQLSEKQKFTCLEIPKNVGGRYSVFSAVGLFPLAMLGIDIDALLQGARDIQTHCLSTDIKNNYAALSAALKYLWYKQGKVIADMFLFSVDCESLGKWYRQLMGESIGKAGVGLTPTVSVGSTDLHSVGQLYLGGERNKFFTFVSIEKSKHSLVIPDFKEFDPLVAHLQKKSLSSVMDSIISGVQQAYKNNNIPFCTVSLPEKNAYYVGQFLQLYMLEMVYLAKLLGVDPFDQPHVELYKQETRKILAHE